MTTGNERDAETGLDFFGEVHVQCAGQVYIPRLVDEAGTDSLRRLN